MKKRILSLILLLIVCFTLPAVAATISKGNKQELIRYIYFHAMYNSKEEIDTVDLFLDTLMKIAGEDDETYEQILKYFTQSIDEYGDYIPPEETSSMDADITGKSGGIGSTVEMRNGKIYVVNVLADSPSDKAGVQVGHTIVKADGIDLYGLSLDEALSYIRGDAGTEVVITFEDPMGKQYDMLLVRDIIEVASVNASTFVNHPEIGYIEITNFSLTTGDELKTAIADFKEQGVTKLVLDLRYNGGGVLEGALQVAGAFLDEGLEIVTVEPRDESLKETYYASGKVFDGELIVLVNEYSASASEIVAGALKEHKRATIVGEKTFGKGTVQHLFSLPLYGGYFKYTISEYFVADHVAINKQGVAPNLTVYNENYKLSEEEIPYFPFMRVMRLGDSGEDVKNMKQALKTLNYSLDDTDIFDQDTFNAVKSFQKTSNLYPYGVCDFTTQQHIKQKLLDTVFYYDTQLDKAIELLTE